MKQEKLGTMLDKMVRVQSTVSELGLVLGISEDMIKIVEEAASLAMSDLATAVVTEFTSLSGIMASHYALRDGYSEQVLKLAFKKIFLKLLSWLAYLHITRLPVMQLMLMIMCNNYLNRLSKIYNAKFVFVWKSKY